MMVDNHVASETEQKLLEIWKDVLKVSTVGVDDEFLDLGGDSLSAMLCVSRMRKTFECELSIEDFFMDGATITNIAAAIDNTRAE